MIAIFCLVHGEPIANAFPIEIDENKTIGTLKELVKEKKKNDFHDIDADKLKLWSVSIPVNNTATLEDLVLENNKEKGVQELLPTDDIADVFSTPLKKHIHVIVERPLHVASDTRETKQLREQLATLQAKLGETTYDFSVLVGRKRKPFTWSANLRTATLDTLKSIILQQNDLKAEFDKEDTSLEFTINNIGEKYKPVSDSDFCDMLRRMVDRHVSQFTVTILTPSKAFSSYDLKTVCNLYGLSDGNSSSLDAFQKLDCNSISGDAFKRELEKLMVTLNEYLLVTPFDATNEATKSIYVHVFIHRAISIFGNNTFRIFPEKEVRGIHGHGYVDFAIDSRRTNRIVGVTEVKRDDFMQGVAQNAVQLDSCLQAGRKRKASEIEGDETSVSKAFGIISDAEKFFFLECQLNGDDKPSFKLSEPVIVNYKSKVMKETVADVLGCIGWLLEEIDKPELSSVIKKQRTM